MFFAKNVKPKKKLFSKICYGQRHIQNPVERQDGSLCQNS